MPTRHLPALLSLLLALPVPAEPLNPLDIYGTREPDFFRRHRVREIVVLEQYYSKGQPSATRRALLVQQFDRQGRVVKEWLHPQEHRFTTLQESAYDAAGHLASLTRYRNESPAADTSLLGQQWRPETRAHYAVSPTQTGYGEQWNYRANAWQRSETLRQWRSHDATYVYTSRLPDGHSGSLVRTYPTPGGRVRTDYVMTGHWFTGGLLFEPQYLYTRQENGRQVEFGRLLFDEALRDYLRQHPALPQPEEETEAYAQLLDQVARHAPGRADTLETRTYDAQGCLLKARGKYAFTTYQRNAQGQVRQTEYYIQNRPTDVPSLQQRIALTYQPNGLVAREEVVEEVNGLTAIRYYRYRYY